jgi:hypothetical protein
LKSSIYAVLYLFGFSIILAVLSIVIMLRSQGWYNIALTMLLLNILLYSIGVITFDYLGLKPTYAAFIIGLEVAG